MEAARGKTGNVIVEGRINFEYEITLLTVRHAAGISFCAHGDMKNPAYTGIERALEQPGTWVRIFGKPEVKGHRRMAVVLALGTTTKDALAKAKRAASKIKVVEG
jgi:phosphoribosylglycinamide formyltransferase 2